MDLNTILALIALILTIPQAVESISNIAEKWLSRRKASNEHRFSDGDNDNASRRQFHWTQAKVKSVFNRLFYVVIYIPYAVLWSIGVVNLNQVVDPEWIRWILSAVFIYDIWFSGIVLFRFVSNEDYQVWLEIWIITSLYGGIGIIVSFYPTWWQSNKIPVAIAQSLLIVGLQVVILLHSGEIFQSWIRSLPEK